MLEEIFQRFKNIEAYLRQNIMSGVLVIKPECSFSLEKKERERKIVKHWNIEHCGEMLQVYNLDCVEEME